MSFRSNKLITKHHSLVRKLLFSLLLSGFLFTLSGQNIDFKIIFRDSAQSQISGNVLFFNQNDTIKILKEYQPLKTSTFNYNLLELYDSLIISLKIFGFVPIDTLIGPINKDDKIALTFILLPIELTPVVVTSQKPPYVIKGDTLKYTVDGYKDGTERTIEDIFKKLPGIKVNKNTGEISFKGIPIETLMIDGVNLFEKNYTIASRTIDISLIDTVSVIENFLPNPLLKGLTTENKVALSVNLKNKSKVFNHQVEGGVGVSDEFVPANIMYNILSLSKNTKLFTNSSYNNIGNSKSPNSPLNQSESPHASAVGQWLLKPTINQINLPQFGTSNRSISNSEITNNLVISPISGQKAKVKIHASQLSDVLKTNINNQSIITLNQDQFVINDEFRYVKIPNEYLMDIYAEYSPTKHLNFISKVFSAIKKDNSKIDHILNLTDTFNQKQNDIQKYIIASSTGTFRIDSSKVIQLNIDFAENHVNQINNVNENNKILNIYLKDRQLAEIKNNVINLNSTLLGTVKKRLFYSVSLGILMNQDYLKSYFTSNRTDSANFIYTDSNQYKLHKSRFFQNFQISYKSNDFTIEIGSKFNSLNTRISSLTLNENQNDFFIEPYAFLQKKIGRNWFISSNMAYNVTPPSIQYQYQKPIMINARISQMNQSNLSLIKNLNVKIQIQYLNLFRHFDAFAAYSHSKQLGGFYQFLQINRDRTIKTNLLLNESAFVNFFNVGVAKFITSISTRFSISAQLNQMDYFNIINSNSLRLNKNSNSNLQLEITNNKLKNLIISGVFETNYSTSALENEIQQKVLGLGLWNKVSYQLFNKSAISIHTEMVKPDSRRNENFTFMDATFTTPPLKEKIHFELSIKNIFNTKEFIMNSVTDFSLNSYSLRLLPRYLMITSRFIF